jgi:hypothetical protein
MSLQLVAIYTSKVSALVYLTTPHSYLVFCVGMYQIHRAIVEADRDSRPYTPINFWSIL